MIAYKVLDTFNADIRTFDLRTPTWPFFLLAWIGLAAAILLLVIRTTSLAFGIRPNVPERHSPIID
jgi:hypothetical protein